MSRQYYMTRIMSDTDELVQKGLIAVGWSKIPFNAYLNNRDNLYKIIESNYWIDGDSRLKGRAWGNITRFLEINIGDIVIVPCYKGFYIGEVISNVEYSESDNYRDLSNQRKVKYKKDIDGNPMYFSRSGKNTALATKLGVRGFVVLNIFNESVISEIDALYSAENDSSYADKVMKQEKDHLYKFRTDLSATLQSYDQIALQAKGLGFEHLIKKMFEEYGFEADILPKNNTRDYSDADILIKKTSSLGNDFSLAFFIQVKHHTGNSSNWGLEQIILYREKIEKGELSLDFDPSNIRYALISSGKFNQDIKEKAADNNIILIDGDRLSEILFDKFDELGEFQYQLGYYKKYEHI